MGKQTKPQILKRPGDGLLLDIEEKQLTKSFILMRIIVFFVLIPFFAIFWRRFHQVDDTEMTFGQKLRQYLTVFDAVHFLHVAENGPSKGYQHELNHAFFPMLPYVTNKLAEILNVTDISLVGFALQTVLSYFNTILIFRVGKKAFGDTPRRRKIAEIAGYLYVISHATVYQISFYSENLFLFCTLAGMYVLYQPRVLPGTPLTSDSVKKEVKRQKKYQFYLPKTWRVVLATYFFALATATRSTGILLSVFVAFFMLHKMIAKSDHYCKLVKFIMMSWLCACIMFLPLFVILYWKPYLLHCESKLERTNEIPPWCLESFPNVYSYIQYIYWDNQLFGLFHRKLDNFLVSLPMFIIFFNVMFRVILEQPVNFFTLGLLNKCSSVKKAKATKLSLFSKASMVPHAWYFCIQILLVLLFANADINSRVASTCPFYYWAVASLIIEGDGTPNQKFVDGDSNRAVSKMTWIAKFAILHNFAYMILNFITFPMEAAFF